LALEEAELHSKFLYFSNAFRKFQQGRPVHVNYDAYLHHGQNKGKPKNVN